MSTKGNIVVLGAAESGVGAAVLAQKQGFGVFVSDFGAIKDSYKQQLTNYGIEWEEGQHTESRILAATEVVKSPGIPDSAPIIQKLMAQKTPIISELEFAARYTNAKLICITGSNGKTTTTMLCYELLRSAGYNVGLAGNVGFSFALQVAEKNFDYYVLEISSFQLDNMYKFKADVAILTNITPDHLDRYDYKFQNYIDSKFRILQNMTEADSFIYCIDDEVVAAELQKRTIVPHAYPYSVMQPQTEGGSLIDNKILISLNNKTTYSMLLEELLIKGKHNVANTMAASIAAKVVDIKDPEIKACLTSFKGVEHRIETVPFSVRGVQFINDSKATNVNSVWYALESINEPIVWIVGGKDKGNDYTPLFDLVRQKVKAIVCMGKDNSKIIEAFKDIIPVIHDTHEVNEAVRTAYNCAQKGDVVLLSPACASFDLFKNYEDRGQQFKTAVRNL